MLPNDDIALGAGREFDLIREMAGHWGSLARGIGDDAAILDVAPGRRLVVSVDSAIDGVHFRSEWLSGSEIGYRATAAALSDLAAMGAEPLGILIALTLPATHIGSVGLLADGIGEAARSVSCHIVGGNTTRGDTLSLTTTVLGQAQQPVRRSGARAGDTVWVTGRLGGPGAALASFLAGRAPRTAHRERFAHPVPRIAEGLWLAGHGATAMIDVSDGIASDVRHVAAASGRTIEIDVDAVPAIDGIAVEDALRSGEEYELLCTAPSTLDATEFERQFRVPLTAIGRVTDSADATVTFLRHGARVDPGWGYDHFTS